MTPDTRPATRLPLFLIPAVVLVVSFAVAVLLAQVAPSRVTTGVYQVVVWEGTDPVVLPPESLTCGRTGGTAYCTAPVGPRLLTVSLTYTGVVEPGPCTAGYGGRPVSCQRQMGFSGHASHTVWLPAGLSLSAAQRAELREAVPWWRVERELTAVATALVVALGVGAAASTFLLRRRARPVRLALRLTLLAATAVLGLAVFVAGAAVISPVPRGAPLTLVPFSVLAATALTASQWELTTTTSTTGAGRVLSAVVAGGAVTLYSGIAVFVFLVHSGFVD